MSATRRPTQANIERDLIAVFRRHKARAESTDAAMAERDRVIRDALGAGLPRRRIVELAEQYGYGEGLSPQRVDQIRRGARL